MASLADVTQALASSFSTGMGLACTKGRPRWALTRLEPPTLALRMLAFRKQAIRLGKIETSAAYEMAVYAENEAALWARIDTFATWAEATTTLTVGTETVSILWGEGDAGRKGLPYGRRHEPETEIEQEEYAMKFEVMLRW